MDLVESPGVEADRITSGHGLLDFLSIFVEGGKDGEVSADLIGEVFEVFWRLPVAFEVNLPGTRIHRGNLGHEGGVFWLHDIGGLAEIAIEVRQLFQAARHAADLVGS